MTHAAVSHQIKALEASIGMQLFVRTSRSVELTPAGEQYYPPTREHIQGIISTFEDGDYDTHRFDVGVFNAPEVLGETETGLPLEALKDFLLLSVPSTWNAPDDWDSWLAAAGLQGKAMQSGPVFDNYPLVREAVLMWRVSA